MLSERRSAIWKITLLVPGVVALLMSWVLAGFFCWPGYNASQRRKQMFLDLFFLLINWGVTLYRVSHFEMDFMNWLWQIKICKLDLVWRWFWNAEIGNFWVPQLFSKKVTSVGLNSLQQKGYQISVKNWIFDDPFHEKGPVLVILVPGMI